MRAVVVGTTGFVGARVADGLRRDGWEVVGVDRRAAPGGDVASAVVGALRGADLVVGCVGSVAGRPADLHDANVRVPAALASAAADAGTPYLHLGSAAEYGSSPGGRASHEDDVAAPTSPYGRSKLEGTRRVLRAHPAALVLRPTTVVGPGSHGFLADLCDQVAAAGPRGTVRLGPLDAARDLVDVADVVRAVLLVARSPYEHAGVLNVGTGRAVPLGHVLARVRALAGFEGRVGTERVSPSPTAAVRTQHADVARIRRTYGWSAAVPLDATIRAMLTSAGRAASTGTGCCPGSGAGVPRPARARTPPPPAR